MFANSELLKNTVKTDETSDFCISHVSTSELFFKKTPQELDMKIELVFEVIFELENLSEIGVFHQSF